MPGSAFRRGGWSWVVMGEAASPEEEREDCLWGSQGRFGWGFRPLRRTGMPVGLSYSYQLSSYYVPGTVLGAGAAAMNKAKSLPLGR